MLWKSFILGALLCAVSVGGCASINDYPSITAANNVAVADVINQLKCEVRDFLREEKYSGVTEAMRLPAEKKADIDLKLQIDISDAAKGSVKLTPLAFAFGPTFTPSFGVTATNTILSDFKFSLSQKTKNLGSLDDDACPNNPHVLGLKNALLSFYASEARIHSGAPYVGLQSITYSTAFGLAYTGGATGSGAAILSFIPLGPVLEASASQTGVHTLQIAFKGQAPAAAKDPKTN